MFVDRVELELLAGKGGDGCMSFRRERYIPRGGPDGGDGGDGGSILVVAEQGVNSLVGISNRKQWRAEKGTHGSGSNRKGKRGEDVTLKVPPGTLILDAEHDFVIKDLTEPGEQFVAARGGKGGRGNAHFKSATNQAPREWTSGEEGEHRRVVFELKVIADVGLIGKPNAGKSTLLSRLSRARPEIANYPFTTKFPNLGQVQLNLDESFVMADIPGLIEGAHQGVGLGHEFLKHVERAGILVHLVEPMPQDGTDPIANYESIREEMNAYSESLQQRPEIVVVSKAELPEAEEVAKLLAEKTGNQPLSISAVTGQGLKELVYAIVEKLRADKA